MIYCLKKGHHKKTVSPNQSMRRAVQKTRSHPSKLQTQGNRFLLAGSPSFKSAQQMIKNIVLHLQQTMSLSATTGQN